MYIICIVITLFFAVIGLCAFILAVIGALTDSCAEEPMLIIPNVSEDDAEIKIRRARYISSRVRCSKVICLCEGKGGAYAICKRCADRYPCIEIMTKEEVKAFI